MKPRTGNGKACPGHFLAFLLYGLIVILLVNYAPGAFGESALAEELQSSGWTVQQQGGSATAQPAGQVQHAPAGQIQQQPEQLGDIQEEEPTYFDPDSIPDSVPVPDANWVFEVPIDVKNLPDNVQRLGITCRVFKFKSITLPHEAQRITFGYAKKRVPLVNGAYKGNVIVGVKYDEELAHWGEHTPSPHKAEEYECKMYLIGPNNHWERPKNSQASPFWRQADPNQPFRWKTGRNNLPQ
ncbi:MAG: hypothetical protein K9J85_09280 [Desulfobacteraceae bacterium]|nr:hypothetical protein [Desulfobacteraceae bacterium]